MSLARAYALAGLLVTIPCLAQDNGAGEQENGGDEVQVGAGTEDATTTGTSGPDQEASPLAAPPSEQPNRRTRLCDEFDSALERARCEAEQRGRTGDL